MVQSCDDGMISTQTALLKLSCCSLSGAEVNSNMLNNNQMFAMVTSVHGCYR